MDTRFDLVEKTYYRKDRFDIPLDSYLFDSIKQLNVIKKGEHPIWKIVVSDLLSTYFMRLFLERLYHFKLSYGNPSVDKSKKQIDFEKHIRLLEPTLARNYISQVCIAALDGHAWQAIQKLRKKKWQDWFKPLFIIYMIRSFPLRILLRIYSINNGAFIALEIFGLFKSLTDEECNAILFYLEKQENNKHDHDEWKISDFTNILTRPGMISKNIQNRFEQYIFTKNFEQKEIQNQVLARLTRISSEALQRLKDSITNETDFNSKRLSEDVLDTLLNSAATNPDVMVYWLDQVSHLDIYHNPINEKTFQKNQVIIDSESMKVVFDFVQDGDESHSKAAEIVLKNIHLVTADAQNLLRKYLKSGNQNERYLAASIINGLSITDRLLIEEAFESLLDMSLDLNSFEKTNTALHSDDNLQQKVCKLLLEICKDRNDLVKKFLVNMRNRWSNEYINAALRVFSGTTVPNEVIENFALELEYGKINDCQGILLENSSHLSSEKIKEISLALRSIQDNNMLIDLQPGDGTTAQEELLSVCVRFIYSVWPCLVAINSNLSSLTSSDYLVLPALLCLEKTRRNTWRSAPISKYDDDSYLSICNDIGKAIEVIGSFDNVDLVINTLVSYSKQPNSDANLIVRAISAFPQPDKRLFEIIREGFGEGNPGQVKQIPWQNSTRLDNEGVSLVVRSILNGRASSDILKSPPTVDVTGANELIKAIKKRRELTDNEILQLWLFIYAIKSLVNSSMVNSDVVDICMDLLHEKVSTFDESHKRDERPFAVWALSKALPLRAEVINLFMGILTSGPSQLISYGHFVWTRVAAIIALSEIGSDTTNELLWEEREAIADIIIKYVKIPFLSDFDLFGGENVFPERPSDAIYDAACLIVETMRKHWFQEEIKIPEEID